MQLYGLGHIPEQPPSFVDWKDDIGHTLDSIPHLLVIWTLIEAEMCISCSFSKFYNLFYIEISMLASL